MLIFIYNWKSISILSCLFIMLVITCHNLISWLLHYQLLLGHPLARQLQLSYKWILYQGWVGEVVGYFPFSDPPMYVYASSIWECLVCPECIVYTNMWILLLLMIWTTRLRPTVVQCWVKNRHAIYSKHHKYFLFHQASLDVCIYWYILFSILQLSLSIMLPVYAALSHFH